MAHETLKEAVRDFLSRDYAADVAALNAALRKPGHSSAGIESAPPSVLTGNPFAVTPGKSIAVFGLNPKWQAGGLSAAWAKEDVLQTIGELDEGRFEDHFKRRASYFDDDSKQYYSRYFDRLGRLIRHADLINASSPREVFRRGAFKLDLLPWWSSDTNSIDKNRLQQSTVGPLLAWVALARQFLVTLQPSLVIVNGSGFREYAARLLELENLQVFTLQSGQMNIYCYCGRCKMGVPVVIHGQVNYAGGPQTPALYGTMINEVRRLCRRVC